MKELGQHINDWTNLNVHRSKPSLTLVSERIKSGAERSILEIWHGLDMSSIPCLLVESVGTCNNSCYYCTVEKEPSQEFEIADFINLVITLRRRGLISAWITGGAPLHDIDRLTDVINVLISENIDIERISTSLVSTQDELKRFADLVNICSKENRVFRCTVAAGVNSYIRNSSSMQMSFEDRLDYIIHRIDIENTHVHIPVIINEPNGKTAVAIAKKLNLAYPDVTFSLKSLIPSVDDFDVLDSTMVSDIDLMKYMDCGIASLFPCTWPMWHLAVNGDLYCCSTWYNDASSANLLGNISSQDIAVQPSEFMKYVGCNGGWIERLNQFAQMEGSDLLNMKVPLFDDNTQKCIICHEMMKQFANMKHLNCGK